MSIPFNSTANLPQGFTTVTINSVVYKIDAIDIPSFENRIIERADENGDRADFMVRAGSEQITGSLTLQRALTTTVLPPEGDTFTLDYDRSGTASTFVVQNVKVDRDKDSFDTFSVDVILQTYQG